MPETTAVYTATEREQVREICRQAALELDIDPQYADNLFHQESNFDPQARNGNCYGLGQINAEFYDVSRWNDPVWNARRSMGILRYLLSYYEGDYLRALAAYHAGVGAVDSAIAARPKGTDWLLEMDKWTLYYLVQVWGGGVNDD